MGDNIFKAATDELDQMIATEENNESQGKVEEQDLGKAIIKGITDAVAPLLNKAQKGAPTSDLSAEKDKRGTLTDSGKDPAETPKKSGGQYPDSKQYTSMKADDDYNDDDDDDDTPPKFFKKKKKNMKKMCKKSELLEDEEDDMEEYDASEFIDGMGDAVEEIGKSCQRLEEGVAVFGELLAENADPNRDKLLVSLAKSMQFVIDKVTKIEKAYVQHSDLMKSIAQMPGMPKVAGMALAKSEDSQTENKRISAEDRNRLFKAAVSGQISQAEMKHAKETGDLSCLKKA